MCQSLSIIFRLGSDDYELIAAMWVNMGLKSVSKISYNIWPYTWYDNIELNIPNTTNILEGHFSDLKNKIKKS